MRRRVGERHAADGAAAVRAAVQAAGEGHGGRGTHKAPPVEPPIPSPPSINPIPTPHTHFPSPLLHSHSSHPPTQTHTHTHPPTHSPARPYSLSLAAATASASVLKVPTDSTGPKISSRQMRMCGFTPANTVGASQ